MFFSPESPFCREGTTGSSFLRLNVRHQAIFSGSGVPFHGRSVLDLGCHDGRWMFAALDAGARSVTGVDGRESNVERARRNFSQLGISQDRFDLRTGDVEDLALNDMARFDVILCLGILYHLTSPVTLLKKLAGHRPDYIIVDTAVSAYSQPCVEMKLEDSDVVGNGLSINTSSRALIGHPSRAALHLALSYFGYTVTEVDVRRIAILNTRRLSSVLRAESLRSTPDYRSRSRVIIVASRYKYGA